MLRIQIKIASKKLKVQGQTAKGLIEKIKTNMNAKAAFKGRNATYQTILFSNLHALAHFVIDRNEALSFDIPELAVKRNDNLDVQQRILAMTPAKRRSLGISKSGLWYQKKKLAEGKTIKVMAKYFQS